MIGNFDSKIQSHLVCEYKSVSPFLIFALPSIGVPSLGALGVPALAAAADCLNCFIIFIVILINLEGEKAARLLRGCSSAVVCSSSLH
jgi:hypothetical protein